MFGVAEPASAGFPGANGRALWVLQSTGSPQIHLDVFSAKPDGSSRVQLTNGDFVEQAIANPSGQVVAYWTLSSTGFVIRVVRIDGGPSHDVLADPTVDYLFLTWSPDGSLYAVISHTGNSANEFVRVGLHGKITPVATLGGLVVFSPVASRVLSITNVATISDPNGANPVVVGSANTVPAWSPDGTRVALPSASAITVVNADGTNSHSFAISSPGPLWWSPDGTTIVYQGGAIHPDGTSATSPTVPLPPPGYQSQGSRFYDWAPRKR
jgi:Tol biopolymer transport system component